MANGVAHARIAEALEQKDVFPLDLHPSIQKTLNFIYAGKKKPLHFLSPAAARVHYETTHAFFDMPMPQVEKVENMVLPGPHGDIPVRLYRPLNAPKDSRLPMLVFFHGGGWVIGSIKTHDRICRYLANAGGALVISVDYRLAPEHKFPIGLEDCMAATVWAAAHGAKIGGDARRLSVGGDSAGANLAAAITHMARDHQGPAIASQILLYPVTDALGEQPSRNQYAQGFALEGATLDWFTTQYVNSPVDCANPLVSPLRAAHFSDLPPAFIVTAGLDPLRDEGEAYAEKLKAAAVPVTCRRYDQMIHGFVTMGGLIPDARRALDEAAETLRNQVSA